MKQQTAFEFNVPKDAESLPDIKNDGSYELVWKLKGGSYVRLCFETSHPIHTMLGKVVALETARRQEATAA